MGRSWLLVPAQTRSPAVQDRCGVPSIARPSSLVSMSGCSAISEFVSDSLPTAAAGFGEARSCFLEDFLCLFEVLLAFVHRPDCSLRGLR